MLFVPLGRPLPRRPPRRDRRRNTIGTNAIEQLSPKVKDGALNEDRAVDLEQISIDVVEEIDFVKAERLDNCLEANDRGRGGIETPLDDTAGGFITFAEPVEVPNTDVDGKDFGIELRRVGLN